ncbi:MAG TPA: hypothetical protein PK507_05000, partial [bacterium]|nr:hypothetical protein [bacterium]
NNAEKIVITRINATQNPSYNHTRTYGPNYSAFEEYDWVNDGNNSAFNTKKEKKEEKSTTIITLPAIKNVKEENEEKKGKINIYTEKPLLTINDYLSIPYFSNLRWYRNGQLITGVYVWINNYGYYPIGFSVPEANKRLEFITDKVFNGKSFCSKEDFPNGKIPFNSMSSSVDPTLFFFVQGVQIKTTYDYARFYSEFLKLKGGEHLDYIALSHVSTHPVINLNFNTKDADYQNIVKDGKIYTGVFTILGSEQIYTIETGNLKKVILNKFTAGIDKKFYEIKKENSDYLRLSQEFISSLDDSTITEQDEILEQSDDELLENMVQLEEDENQIIKDLCNEDFTEPIKDFQQIRTKLFNNFSENDMAIRVISFVDNAMEDMKEFIN